jgi:hypothetical protein
MKVFEEPTFGEKMRLEEEFFSNKFLLSYSGLNKLLFSPDAFYRHYVLRQREDTQTQAMIEGSLLHCLLLQPDEFDELYILNHEDLPSPAQQSLMNHLFGYYKADLEDGSQREELSEYEGEILEYLTEINLYQSLKNDTGRLAKILTEKNETYWEYLKKAEGRTVIDFDTYNHITEAVDRIKSNPTVMECLGFFADSMNGIKTMNELELALPDTEYEFGLRGIIDNLVFDPGKKEIRINDLKSTTKNLSSFTESIDYYKYWIQASMYYKLVRELFAKKPEYEGWTITYRFIVVDKYCATGIIRITADTRLEWENATDELLKQADYHFKKRDFKLPYEFLINENELVI